MSSSSSFAGASATSVAVDRSRASTSRSPFSGHSPARRWRRSPRSCRREAAATERFVLEPLRYRETRSVGMLVLADPSGRATSLANRVQRGTRRSRCVRARAPPVVAARHRPAVSRAPQARPAVAGDRTVRSVRGRCFAFTPALVRGTVRGTRVMFARRPEVEDDETRGSARRRTGPDRAAVREGLGDAHERPSAGLDRRDLDGLARSRHGTRNRRPASWASRRDLRPRGIGQDDPRLPPHRRGATAWRHLRIHRRGARHGSVVRAPDRRRHRQPPRLPARHGRAGARDLRAPHSLGRPRHRRGRLGRSARAEGGDRGRDGRFPRRPAGALDEPGSAEARRDAQSHRHDLHLHEPAPREDRRHVRQSRRRRRVVARSSSTPRSVSTSAGSRR